jgi:hypothetical protein
MRWLLGEKSGYREINQAMTRTFLTYLIFAMTILVGAPLLAQEKIKLRRPGSSAPETSTAFGGGEKITLTRPSAGTTSAPVADGEYSTSRGPESRKRTLYMGPMFGFNVGGISQGFSGSENADGWEASPYLGLRSELYFKRVYGIIADFGYEQNRAYITETPTGGYAGQALLRTDYLMFRTMFSYRYSLYKVFSKVKFLRPMAGALKSLAGNLQAGTFIKTPLSAQLEIATSKAGVSVGDPNDPNYDVREFTTGVSGGLMAGLGFELRLGEYIFFLEGQYFRGVLNAYNPIQSRYFNTDKFSEQGIYVSSGIKTGIYGF